MDTFIKKITGKFDNMFIFSFVSSVITAFIVHFMYYANIIYNWDCMLNGPERLGVGIGEGRFFVSFYLSILKVLNRETQINYYNGLVGILFLSLSVALIIQLFKIKDKIIALFIVLIFICYPSVTSLNFHYYCTNVYAVSCFFSVLGAVLILNNKLLLKILGSILIGFSIGGYQSYVGLSFSMIFIYYIFYCIRSEEKVKIKPIAINIIMLLLSFAFYKIFLTIFEAVYNTKSSFPLDLKTVVTKFFGCYQILFTLPFTNFGGLSSYINSTDVLKLSYLFALIVTFIYLFLVLSSANNKIKFNVFISALFIIFLPPSMFFINIFSDRVPDALMMQSFTFYFIFPLLLHNFLQESEKSIFDIKIVSNIFNALMIVIVLAATVQYTYMDAYNYHMLAEENRIADLKYNELITRIESTDGYTSKTPVALIGYMPFTISATPYSEHRTWIRGGYLISEPSVEAWIRPNYFRKVMNYLPRQVNDEGTQSIIATAEYQNMPTYPNSGSIKMISNALVVKLPGSREEIYSMYFDE